MLPPNSDRRQILKLASATAAAATISPNLGNAQESEIQHTTESRRLLKTLKINMVKVKGSLTKKFQVAKAAGFDGIELNSPSIDVAETKKAIEESGLPVDGSVCSTHWNITHSNPDSSVRAQALKNLETALRETHAVGGHTVLLVVGVGRDGTEEEVWNRSVENIRLALPLAAELGMTIAIENVWNQFCYTHDGPDDQTAEKFVRYVDDFDSPWVGMQFDIGNHWKYGNPAEWIRQLGKRIVKFDIKGYSRAKNNWADITEDDLPWAEVRKAIDEIGFYGWIAAEVSGGQADRLTKVAKQIDKALNIATG